MKILPRNQAKRRFTNMTNAIHHIGNAVYATSTCVFGLDFADTLYSVRANMGVMDFSMALPMLKKLARRFGLGVSLRKKAYW